MDHITVAMQDMQTHQDFLARAFEETGSGSGATELGKVLVE